MEENTNVNLGDLQEVVVGESKTESTGVQLGMTVLEESSKNYTIQLGSNEYMQIIGTPEQRQEMFEAWAGYIGEVSNPLKTAANYNKGRCATCF